MSLEAAGIKTNAVLLLYSIHSRNTQDAYVVVVEVVKTEGMDAAAAGIKTTEMVTV